MLRGYAYFLCKVASLNSGAVIGPLISQAYADNRPGRFNIFGKCIVTHTWAA